MSSVEFIETSIFTHLITNLLEDDDYRDLQEMLAGNLEAGDLIPGGGGLRKLRWASVQRHKGKRGGMRVIYYVYSRDKLYMIYAYAKNTQADLTKVQLKMLREHIKGALL